MRSKGQPVRLSQGSPAEPTPRRPERWAVDAGARDVAQLTVPPDAKRDRVFELFCCLHVRTAPGRDDAWHSLRVLVNGAQEWSRRVPTDAGGRDSLDYRFRRVVPSGEALRVVATAELHGGVPVTIGITAEEDT